MRIFRAPDRRRVGGFHGGPAFLGVRDPKATREFRQDQASIWRDNLRHSEAMHRPHENAGVRLDPELCEPSFKLDGALIAIRNASKTARSGDILHEGAGHRGGQSLRFSASGASKDHTVSALLDSGGLFRIPPHLAEREVE